MLSKKHRFSFKNKLPRNILNSRSFSLRHEKNDSGRLQAAVVVSRRVDKRAVVRNKIKRRILEIVRKKIDLNMPLSLVFYIKKQTLESSNLEKEIDEAINNLTL